MPWKSVEEFVRRMGTHGGVDKMTPEQQKKVFQAANAMIKKGLDEDIAIPKAIKIAKGIK